MERLKVKVQPLFILYVFLCIYFGWYNDIFYYIVVLYLHEYGHYIMLRKLGYDSVGMVFAVYGSSLKTCNHYKPKDEILISIAGPIVNVILIICTIALWWVFPTTYMFTRSFVICNAVVMLFNLLPIYPLDGGRVLVASLSHRIKREKLEKVSSVICGILGVILLGLFVISLFYKINYNCLFIGVFLILNSTGYKVHKYANMLDVIDKKYNTPMEVKTFRVNRLNKRELIKYLSPHYYSIFEIEYGEYIKTIEERDLFIN